jgi:hypothetical protein
MWHIPDDLQPGSIAQEEPDVAVSPSRLGVGGCMDRSMSAPLHSQRERLTWKKHLLRTAVALAVGLAITWIVWL